MVGFNDLLERHLQRPVVGAIQTLREKVREISDILDGPAALDQYPGRTVPFTFTRFWRIDNPVTARRDADGAGHELLATLATPGTYLLPREGTVKVGRFGTFTWTRASLNVYQSLTYAADPGFGTNVSLFTRAGDIFDDVVQNNGGAVWSGNRLFHQYDPAIDDPKLIPNVSLRLGLYDKLRGAFLHDTDRMPINFASGQLYANRLLQEPIPFDANADIEPRLYVDEIRVANALDTTQAFNAARLRTFVVMSFIGYINQNDTAPSDRARA